MVTIYKFYVPFNVFPSQEFVTVFPSQVSWVSWNSGLAMLYLHSGPKDSHVGKVHLGSIASHISPMDLLYCRQKYHYSRRGLVSGTPGGQRVACSWLSRCGDAPGETWGFSEVFFKKKGGPWGALGISWWVALCELNSAGWKGLESLWSTSWKQSMFYHTFPQGEHLWFLAGSLAETDKWILGYLTFTWCFWMTSCTGESSHVWGFMCRWRRLDFS